jgi:hypothetical protein
MVWIRTASRYDITIRTELETLQAFLLDIPKCGSLMPSVRNLDPLGDDVYHYVLEEFSNGAVSLAPDYEARFDKSNPAELRWEPHGEHNFRSWGAFRTTPGGVPGEVVLEIDTHAEADIKVADAVVPLVRPFAQRSSDEVTKGFLHNVKEAVEAQGADRSGSVS